MSKLRALLIFAVAILAFAIWDQRRTLLDRLKGEHDVLPAVRDGRMERVVPPARDRAENFVESLGDQAESSPQVASSVQPHATSLASLQNEVDQSLKSKCGMCHGEAPSHDQASSLVLSDVATFRSVITPGDGENSTLVRQAKDAMPPPESGLPPLTSEEINNLIAWIDSLAQDRPSISLAAELDLVAGDLESLDKTHKGDTFYVSFRTIHNQHEVGGDELDTYRTGLFKIVNSLSWRKELVVLPAIDVSQTVFRINLADFGWDKQTFVELIRSSPYSVVPKETRPGSAQYQAATRVVRGDWLVAQLALPRIYHRFLYDSRRSVTKNQTSISTLRDLLEYLHVDFDREFSSARVQRAFINHGQGTSGSKVSDNYRVVDFVATEYGPLWISYDFASSNEKQDVKLLPWGSFTQTREDGFIQNGGEIIFALPNGLHAYMIVDKSGKRIEEAPSEIVREPNINLSPLRSNIISNGISCFQCHADGFQTAEDLISPVAFLDLKQRPLIIETQQAWRSLVEDQNADYVQTLGQIGVTDTEPISYVTKRYLAPLTPDALAAEFELGNSQSVEENMRVAMEQFLASIRDGDSSLRLSMTAEEQGLIEQALNEFLSNHSNRLTRPSVEKILKFLITRFELKLTI